MTKVKLTLTFPELSDVPGGPRSRVFEVRDATNGDASTFYVLTVYSTFFNFSSPSVHSTFPGYSDGNFSMIIDHHCDKNRLLPDNVEIVYNGIVRQRHESILDIPEIRNNHVVHLLELRPVNDAFVEATRDTFEKMDLVASLMGINRPGMNF